MENVLCKMCLFSEYERVHTASKCISTQTEACFVNLQFKLKSNFYQCTPYNLEELLLAPVLQFLHRCQRRGNFGTSGVGCANWSLRCCRHWKEKEENVFVFHISRRGLEIPDKIYRCEPENMPGSIIHGTGVNVAGIARA